MPSIRTFRLVAIAAAWAVIPLSNPPPALADGKPPLASIPGPDATGRIPVKPRTRPAGTESESTSGWWMGSVGIAAALAVFGGVSLASKRFLPTRDNGPFQVVGRSSLSPKHSVYLLRVGNRVLILGAGPQGPPSTLGEVTDPIELARLAPRRSVRPGSEPVASAPPSAGFDRRIGDDE